MRPGKTIFEWMQDHDVRSLGIDVRRFASFGVIKVPHLSPPKKFEKWEQRLTLTPGTGIPPPRSSLASAPH